MNNGRDCDHGRQVGKCDTCDLIEAEQQNTSLLSLLADIRQACGDDGKRMQNELVQYIADLHAKATERDALVVKLPPTCCRTLIFEQENTLEAGMVHGEYYELDDIHDALNKAGIRYE